MGLEVPTARSNLMHEGRAFRTVIHFEARMLDHMEQIAANRTLAAGTSGSAIARRSSTAKWCSRSTAAGRDHGRVPPVASALSTHLHRRELHAEAGRTASRPSRRRDCRAGHDPGVPESPATRTAVGLRLGGASTSTRAAAVESPYRITLRRRSMPALVEAELPVIRGVRERSLVGAATAARRRAAQPRPLPLVSALRPITHRSLCRGGRRRSAASSRGREA